jgi:hypothetical protein
MRSARYAAEVMAATLRVISRLEAAMVLEGSTVKVPLKYV